MIGIDRQALLRALGRLAALVAVVATAAVAVAGWKWATRG